ADPAVLQTWAGALLAAQRLTEAEEVLEAYYRAQPDSYEKLFELADLYCKAGQPEKSIGVLKRLREYFSNAQREKEFLERVETIYDLNQAVVPLAEFVAGLFDEANLESRYAQVLGKLFGVYLAAGDATPAADVLERLIELDPYDFENQQRLEQLKGKLDDTRFRAVASRITSAATVTGQATFFSQTGGQMAEAADDPQKKEAVLEDLIVQVEIFLQYSLKTKAIEKLGKLHELFPGEEARNARLYKLYEETQFFPPGFAESPPRGGAPTPAAPAAPAPSADAVSHLAKISEITHTLFRQRGPKEILQAAVAELGKYLRASRCLGVLGRPGKLPSVTVEFCAPGVSQSPRAAVVRLLALLGKVKVDSETGVVLDAELSPELKQVGAKSVLAMPLIEKEKQEPVGLLVLSQADSLRQWNPNEVYLLKAVADQVETAVSHTKLRSLMKTMTVADDGTGLLRRSSYLDTLVAEVGRHKTQGTSLVVVLLELDKGASLLHRVGEATMEKFMREASTIVLGQTRQNDLAFWYSATALALVLGDTTAKQCQPMVEKLRTALLEVKLPGVKDSPSFSAAISEAAIRPDYDEPDIVTDVINRAEFTLEEARKKGNAVAVW
ncbi:MAG: GAF domain-containing protein, partial [Candidatus Acidiferrales bacterium]